MRTCRALAVALGIAFLCAGAAVVSAPAGAGAAATVSAAAAGSAAARPTAALDARSVIAAANRLRADFGLRPLARSADAGSEGGESWLIEPDGDTATVDILGGWPELLAYVLDPRTTAAALEERADGAVSLVLATDDSLSLDEEVLPARLTPAASAGIALLVPRRPRQVQLLEERGEEEVAVPVTVDRIAGAFGAWLVTLDAAGGDDGLRLAYAGRYRLVLDGMSWSYVTPQLPRAYRARSWRFGPTMRPKERAAWRRAIASAPAFARQVIAEVDGGLTVHRRACDDEESSCAQYDESGAYSVSIAPIDFRETFANLRFVTLHELGHIVDYIGLDAAAYADFRALFRSSPRWRNCFPDDWSDTGCVPFSEILADQFAYWATGLAADPSGGYGDPPLADPDDFEAVLREHWGFRPPLWRNPAVR